MMGVFRMRETEVGEKDGEIEQLRHDLQHIQVRACTCCFLYYIVKYNYVIYWLQAVVEAKDTQLQHKDGQIQRQAMGLQEMTLQLNRQLREVQTLRVRNISIMHDEFMLWSLRVKCTNSSNRPTKKTLKSTDNRERYKH